MEGFQKKRLICRFFCLQFFCYFHAPLRPGKTSNTCLTHFQRHMGTNSTHRINHFIWWYAGNNTGKCHICTCDRIDTANDIPLFAHKSLEALDTYQKLHADQNAERINLALQAQSYLTQMLGSMRALSR